MEPLGLAPRPSVPALHAIDQLPQGLLPLILSFLPDQTLNATVRVSKKWKTATLEAAPKVYLRALKTILRRTLEKCPEERVQSLRRCLDVEFRCAEQTLPAIRRESRVYFGNRLKEMDIFALVAILPQCIEILPPEESARLAMLVAAFKTCELLMTGESGFFKDLALGMSIELFLQNNLPEAAIEAAAFLTDTMKEETLYKIGCDFPENVSKILPLMPQTETPYKKRELVVRQTEMLLRRGQVQEAAELCLKLEPALGYFPFAQDPPLLLALDVAQIQPPQLKQKVVKSVCSHALYQKEKAVLIKYLPSLDPAEQEKLLQQQFYQLIGYDPLERILFAWSVLTTVWPLAEDEKFPAHLCLNLLEQLVRQGLHEKAFDLAMSLPDPEKRLRHIVDCLIFRERFKEASAAVQALPVSPMRTTLLQYIKSKEPCVII